MKRFSLILIFCLIVFNLFSQLPEFQWAMQCGNPPNSSDTRSSIASCPDGCFFLAGEFVDTVQFGAKAMVSAGGNDIFIVKNNAEGEPLWSIRFGGDNDEYLRDILLDNDGNVIVTGYFYGTTQIGTDQYTSYGSQDVFVAKYNAEGNFLWSYRAGGPMADYLSASAADAGQNIIISGYFYGSILFGDTTLVSTSGSDIYLAKLSSSGTLTWLKSAGGSSSDQVNSADIDHDGNILLAGSYYYNINFGDTTITTTNPVGVFIARYNPDGNLLNVFQLDGTYLLTEILITTTSSNSFYISGAFSEQITFGGQVFDAGEFNQDIYIARYDGSCNLLWARHAHSISSDQVTSLETDSFENLYLAGHYLDTIHFDSLVLPYTLCCGSREIFIVNYSAAGNVLWGDNIAGTRAKVQAIAMNNQEQLLISGLFTEEMTMGALSLTSYDGFKNYVTGLQTEIYTKINHPGRLNDLKICPNPASSIIAVTGIAQNTDFDYYISDISGKIILRAFVKSGEFIDISAISPGLYVLQLKSHGGSEIYHNVFIKR